MDAPAPKRRRFVAVSSRPDPALVARQMEATALAYSALVSVDEARRFLNGIDDELEGRPIDVAGASVEGLQRVAKVLTGRRSQSDQAALSIHPLAEQPTP